MKMFTDMIGGEDSELWIQLIMAADKFGDLADRLAYIRNAGSILILNKDFGYVIKPIIGENGWKSQEEYDMEKKCLLPYRNELVMILRILWNQNKIGG